MKKHYLLCLFLSSLSVHSNAQTIGLMQHDAGSLDDGYILYTPTASTNTYLIDKCGRLMKSWTSNYTPGLSVYLLPDGTLLRAGKANNPNFGAGGTGGIVEKIDWDNNVTWSYTFSDPTHCQHHDVRALPNGNVLLIAWETMTPQQCIDAGRDTDAMPQSPWSLEIQEIQPEGLTGGNVVWEWHLWDHLIQDFDPAKANFGSVSDNPQLMNINYIPSTDQDWIHTNSIDYNPALDQIMVSSFTLGELWIIDHSTTTEEAAGHTGGNSGKGGDFLYRIGNPAATNHDISGNILFNGQHNAQWIEDGLPFSSQILVHNNGNGRIGGNYSTVEIFDPPVDGYNYTMAFPTIPSADTWIYNAGNPDNYYAPFISGAQQLPNGNVLICNGPAGMFFEVNAAGETVWKYNNPVNDMGPIPQGQPSSNAAVFRCTYYPFDYSGFAGHTLVAGSTIEDTNPLSENCSLNLAAPAHVAANDIVVYPNPATSIVNINLPIAAGPSSVSLINDLGQRVYAKSVDATTVSVNTSQFPSGLYFLKVETAVGSFTKKVTIE